MNGYQGLFNVRVNFAAAREADRNRDASAGKHDPNRPVKRQTPEESAEIKHLEMENRRWEHLENGTLPVDNDTVEWVQEKAQRLSKSKLPPNDPRRKWFKTYMDRAGKATTEQVPA
jgi:hypothetical protein